MVTGITGTTTGMVGGSFTVQSLGADSTLGFAVNEWVELIDDDVVMTGGTGWLALIGNVDPGTLTVTLSASSPTGVIAYGKNPKIRRWDQTDTTAINGVLTATTPVELENGVQVSFGGSMLYAGDYWMIPARTAIDEETGTLDYPATPQTASYSAHNDASLAVIAFDTSTGWGTPSDCRIPFPPLTGLPKATAGCCTTVTVGDGVTSFGDYTDIGVAIAALPSGGGVVGIEAGTYSIGTPIVVPTNVTLRGCPGQSIIQAQAGAFIVEGDNVSITGLRFELSHGCRGRDEAGRRGFGSRSARQRRAFQDERSDRFGTIWVLVLRRYRERHRQYPDVLRYRSATRFEQHHDYGQRYRICRSAGRVDRNAVSRGPGVDRG